MCAQCNALPYKKQVFSTHRVVRNGAIAFSKKPFLEYFFHSLKFFRFVTTIREIAKEPRNRELSTGSKRASRTAYLLVRQNQDPKRYEHVRKIVSAETHLARGPEVYVKPGSWQALLLLSWLKSATAKVDVQLNR